MEDFHLIINFLCYYKEDNLVNNLVYSLKKYIFNCCANESNGEVSNEDDDLDSITPLSDEKKEFIFLFYKKLELVFCKNLIFRF